MSQSRQPRLFPGRFLNESLSGAVRVGLALAVGLASLVWPGSPGGRVPLAMANGGIDGSFTQTTATDFSGACTALTGSIPTPVLASTTVSPVNGGELRLAATLEDYFDGTEVDLTRWITGTAQAFYTSTVVVAGGYVILDGTYLRSVQNFQSTQPRFFEARVRNRVLETQSVGWTDVGFYREDPPLAGIFPATSAYRIFVTRDDGSVYGLARDGDGSVPGVPTEIDPAPTAELFNIYRLEWDAGAVADTRFLVNDAPVGTLSGSSDLNTWAFLYQQEDSFLATQYSQLYVDWVRAGQYATSGTYTSCARDAGGVVNWSTLTATTVTTTTTTAAFETRTSLDGTTWSSWEAVTGSTVASPSGRFFQYRTTLGSSNPYLSPEVAQVVVNYYGPSSLQVTPTTISLDPGATQTFTVAAFDGNSRAVTGLNYTWGLNAGGGVLGATGVFTAGLPAGTFANTVAVTVTTTGSPVSGSASVSVNDLPPTADAGGPYTVAEGSSVNVTGSGVDPNGLPIGVSWDLDDNGSFETPGSPASFAGVDDGVYTVRLRALENGGAELLTVVTASITVTNVAPVVTITGAPTTTVAEGTAVTLGQLVTDAGVADTHTFAWSVTKGGNPFASGSGASFTFTPDDDGSYVATVVATDDDGGQDSEDVTVTVVNVAPAVSITRAPASAGPGVPVTLGVTTTDAGSADTHTYAWTVTKDGDPFATGSGASYTFTPDGAGVYEVTVEATDDDGGLATDTVTIGGQYQLIIVAVMRDY